MAGCAIWRYESRRNVPIGTAWFKSPCALGGTKRQKPEKQWQRILRIPRMNN